MHTIYRKNGHSYILKKRSGSSPISNMKIKRSKLFEKKTHTNQFSFYIC